MDNKNGKNPHNFVWRCYRSDAYNRKHSQKRKTDNMTSNLLRIANSSAIAATSKMTTGMSACGMYVRMHY